MAKSVFVTYLLWLFGGGLGLHHFYLRRDKQALAYWCLPGGYFGAGWIRDLWRIPEYVRDANGDVDYLVKIAERQKKYKRPPFSIARFCGMIVVGNMFGVLVGLSAPIPEELNGFDLTLLVRALSPAATALGIWLVGNIGREQGSILWPLLGCYLSVPFYILGGLNSNALTSLMGIIAFLWKAKQWRKFEREPTPVWKRILILSLCGGLYSSLWISYGYFNMRITTKDGDTIPLRDAVGNFLKSPAVQEFSRNLGLLWEHCWEHGFYSTLNQVIDSLDPLGEKNSLKVLDLPKGSTQEEIKQRYRELSKKWHPDKFKIETEKEEAHQKFMEIQQAYEKLSDIKNRRAVQNKKTHQSAEG